jgi:predicted TPR repeat methyltransferase
LKPFPASSGDPLADRRADYAEMLFANGEHAAAAELLLGALELAPNWAMGWFRLGEFHEAAGAAGEAEQAFRMALKLDPADRPGAALKLGLLGVEAAPSAPSSAFVEALFDQYAATFDQSLVGKLEYRVPELLAAAIQAAAPGRRFRHALDLGCGTGLMGDRLRPFVERLEGFDISAEMLRKARAKGIYDGLERADLQELKLAPGAADLITAADVFMYVGALDRVFERIAAGLGEGGLFAFSVEKHDGPEDFVLRETRRYAHSEGYVRQTLAASGLSIRSLITGIVRKDRYDPVEGLIVVATSQA